MKVGDRVQERKSKVVGQITGTGKDSLGTWYETTMLPPRYTYELRVLSEDEIKFVNDSRLWNQVVNFNMMVNKK